MKVIKEKESYNQKLLSLFTYNVKFFFVRTTSAVIKPMLIIKCILKRVKSSEPLLYQSLRRDITSVLKWLKPNGRIQCIQKFKGSGNGHLYQSLRATSMTPLWRTFTDDWGIFYTQLFILAVVLRLAGSLFLKVKYLQIRYRS